MASSVQYRTIDLQGTASPYDSLQFLTAEIPHGPYLSSFAVVRYSQDGMEQKQGLRLDLDKGVFLDHFEDPEKEAYLQSHAAAVVSAISEVLMDELFKKPSAAPRQQIFICYQADEDEYWARLFQLQFDKHFTRASGRWQIKSMNVKAVARELSDWPERLSREIASSAAIIILINKQDLDVRSALSTLLHHRINDAHADGVEIVPVLTNPDVSEALFHATKEMFQTKPYIIKKDGLRTVHDVAKHVERVIR